jgi:hypothetical protein
MKYLKDVVILAVNACWEGPGNFHDEGNFLPKRQVTPKPKTLHR